MDKETRQNPETWGITEQEMNFADYCVMIYFHGGSISSGETINAARDAGYEIPKDILKAETFGKSLKKKTQVYIDAEIERFRDILSGEQRRNLWKYISDFTAGTPEPGATSGDYGSIIRH